MMDPFLVMLNEQGRQQSLAGKASWAIGRSADNDIMIDSQWISRHHAMFQRTDEGSVYFIDLGSHNGSTLNGQRIVAPVRLADGDRLVLGRVMVEFRAPGTPAARGPLAGASAGDQQAMTVALRDKLLVSVLVVDIRDFTVLARTIDDQVFSKAVAAFHTRASRILRAHGSWGAKSTGDGQTAVWTHEDGIAVPSQQPVIQSENEPGSEAAPGPIDVHLGRVFGATLAIAEMAGELQHEFALNVPLRIGAGVNTGFAMVGYIGTGDRPEYAAVGDTVNAAFRLESATKQTGVEVMIGENTYDQVFRQCRPPASLEFSLGGRSPFARHALTLKGYDTAFNAYGCSFADLREFMERSKR
ncbi:MAG TPA: adenylate/guanylate cyclase domain-containing protein [Tepidisphaeraceae bacterium]|nr:adenylate/guanylate cyclase domain-containing protein [Tepidisphaeraceae bacterium]